MPHYFATLIISALSVSILAVAATAQTAQLQQPELNTILMNSTFRIQGQSGNGMSLGTGFLLGRPYPNEPTKARLVLVTAAHVLNDLTGDSAYVLMRQKVQSGWQEVPVPMPIRSSGKPLWVQHPKADVAAIYVTLPTALVPPLVPTGLLADDKTLTQYEIHPGDELNVLGYPLGYQNPGGFPVLRSGKIASYPLVPTTENPYFLLDFRVFKGNSGGPVYFVQSNRIVGGSMQLGSTIQMLMGLVSEEVGFTQQFQSLYENRSETYPLGLAKIVPASYLIQTVDMLPVPSE